MKLNKREKQSSSFLKLYKRLDVSEPFPNPRTPGEACSRKGSPPPLPPLDHRPGGRPTPPWICNPGGSRSPPNQSGGSKIWGDRPRRPASAILRRVAQPLLICVPLGSRPPPLHQPSTPPAHKIPGWPRHAPPIPPGSAISGSLGRQRRQVEFRSP